MLGAIAGDIIGSLYERKPIKTTAFALFGHGARLTDDTVLTVAVADAILHRRDYGEVIRDYARRYPRAGYGQAFRMWARSDHPEPYGSFGNGSAMRVSPVAHAFDSLERVLEEAKRSAEVTHNHSEGIKGAQATAAAVFLARSREPKDRIRAYVEDTFGYDLGRSIDEIRPAYRFDVTCQGSVPEAIRAFLDAADFEQAIRLAISLGGDADTQACITGAIAEPYFGLPADIEREALARLDVALRAVVEEFRQAYPAA
jgi:ADP-ribosylglycohydrolase